MTAVETKPLLVSPTPQEFWDRYRARLQWLWDNRRECFANNAVWAPMAIDAGAEVCRSFNLATDYERPSRLDVSGSSGRTLTIAFEHEMGLRGPKNWTQELEKLSGLTAELKVLVAYFDVHPQRLLESEIARRGIDTSGKWLFICGNTPSSFANGQFWMAYTLEDGRLVKLEGEWE